MPNPVKILGYIKCYSTSSPRPVNNPNNLSAIRGSAVDREDPKPYQKSEKRPHFSKSSTMLLFTSFSNASLTTESKWCIWHQSLHNLKWLLGRTSMREHDTKTTPVSLPADGEVSRSLIPSTVSLLPRGTVQPENTYSRILKVTGQVWENQKKG